MSKFKIELKKAPKFPSKFPPRQLHVTTPDIKEKYNLEGWGKGCRMKVNPNGELEHTLGIDPYNTLTTRLLLQKGDDEYIKTISVEKIRDNHTIKVVGNDDFRDLRANDSNEFTFNLSYEWVSLHVEREVELDTIVQYLVIGCSKIK